MQPSRSLRRLRRRAPSLSRSSRFHPRGLSLSLPLDIAPPLFSSRTFSLFHPPPPRPPPVPSRSFAHIRPVPILSHPLGLLSRSSLVPPFSSRLHFRSYRHVLRSSRVTLPLSVPLFPPRRITTLSRLARSSSNPLPTPLVTSPSRASSHSSRARHPFRRSVSVSIRFGTPLFFSPFLSSFRFPFFPSPSFSLFSALSFSD